MKMNMYVSERSPLDNSLLINTQLSKQFLSNNRCQLSKRLALDNWDVIAQKTPLHKWMPMTIECKSLTQYPWDI